MNCGRGAPPLHLPQSDDPGDELQKRSILGEAQDEVRHRRVRPDADVRAIREQSADMMRRLEVA